MSFAQNALSIFARQATFLLNWWVHLGPFHALYVDMELALSSSCLVPKRKKINYICPLASVPRACFTLVNPTIHLQLVRQRSERIVWLLFLQIYSVQSLVAHFHLLPSLYAPAMMVHAHHLNRGR